MTERKIVGFRATGWLKTIAWLQILYTLIVGTVGSTGCLFLLGYARYASGRLLGSEYFWEVFIWTIGINLSTISTAFGVILLIGAKQKNVNDMIQWAKCGRVYVVLYIIALLWGVLTGSGAIIITVTCLVLLPLVWTVFGIWIVKVIVEAPSTPNGNGDKEISQKLLLPPSYTSYKVNPNANQFSQHV